MAGFSLILVMFPFLIGMIGVLVVIIGFLGICLMVGGISGFILNKLYSKEKGTKEVTVKNLWYYVTFALGLLVFVFPIAILIYNVIVLTLAALG